MEKFSRLFSLSLLVTVNVAQAQGFGSHESSVERFSGNDLLGFGAGRGHPLGGGGRGGGGDFVRPFGALSNSQRGAGFPTQRKFGGVQLQLGGEIGHPLSIGGGSRSLEGGNVIGLPLGGIGSRHLFGSSVEDDFPLGVFGNGRRFPGDDGIVLPLGGMGRGTDISSVGLNGNSFGGPVGTSLPGTSGDNGRFSSGGNGGVSIPATGLPLGNGNGGAPLRNGGNGGSNGFVGNGGVGLPVGNGNGGAPLRNGGNGGSNGFVGNGGVGLPLGNGNNGRSTGQGSNGGSHQFGGNGGVGLPLGNGNNGFSIENGSNGGSDQFRGESRARHLLGGGNRDPLGYSNGIGLPGL